MRRRLAFLLAGAIIVAACGGGATPTPEPLPSATPAPTDIFSGTPLPSEAATTQPDASVDPWPAESTEPTTPGDGTTYTVKAGDTMWQISIDLGVTLAALKEANPTVDPKKLQVGSVLIIPPKQ